MPEILDHADAIVVVAGASMDEARLASETLDLVAVRHPELAAQAVVAVQSASQTTVNVGEIEAHFRSRARGVVRIPRDSHLAEGSVIELTRLSSATRRAALELSALVVGGLLDETPAQTPAPVTATAPAPVTAPATPERPPVLTPAPGLSDEQRALLRSSGPKVIVLDDVTGHVVSVATPADHAAADTH
jgi:hypothetical protein